VSAGEAAYRGAGVDLDVGHAAVELIRRVAAGAARPEMVTGVGPFAGVFAIDEDRLLVASTDGVGTKLEVARLVGRLDTVGIDLVAMSANDVVTTGAEPLFFLDYLAVGRIVPEEAAAIVAGVAEGCRRAGCALLGGETAEHPDTMEAGRFDLAGFCVGTVRRADLLGPERVEPGDVLLGLPSSGLHANGFSLVRRALLDGRSLDEPMPVLGRSLAEELLEPTAIYVRPVLDLARRGLIRSAAHLTGGGWIENVPRALPAHLGAEVDPSTWVRPAIFDVVAGEAGLEPDDLFGVLNMGIGMVLVIQPSAERECIDRMSSSGIDAVRVGTVVEVSGVRFAGQE
jgi:phosphoribosylformylglycinamidine cyclo-ligase